MFFEVVWFLLFISVIFLFGLATFQEIRSKQYLNAAGVFFIGVILILFLKACG